MPNTVVRSLNTSDQRSVMNDHLPIAPYECRYGEIYGDSGEIFSHIRLQALRLKFPISVASVLPVANRLNGTNIANGLLSVELDIPKVSYSSDLS